MFWDEKIQEKMLAGIFQKLDTTIVVYECEIEDSEEGQVIKLEFIFGNEKFGELSSGVGTTDIRAIFPYFNKSIKKILKFLKNNESYSAVFQHGSRKWYEIRVSALAGKCIVVFIDDRTEIRQIENELRMNKEKYLTVSEKAPVSIISFDSEGIIDFVNDYHIERFSRNQVNKYYYIGKHITELETHINAGINVEILKVLDGVPLEIKELFVPEFEGGHSGYINIRVVPVIKDDKVIGGISIREDVTDRILAEKTWKEQEKRFRLVSGLVTDYVYSAEVIADNNIRFEWTTAAFRKITGYDDTEIASFDDWKNIVLPVDQDIVREKLRKLLRGEKDISEYRIITKQGEIYWVKDYSHPIWNYNYNRVTHIYGAIKDYTETRRTQEAYKVLVDHSVQGLVIIQDRQIVFCNPAVYLLTGYTVEELLAMNEETVISIIFPDDRELFVEMMQAYLGCKPAPQSFEFRMIRRNGDVRWFEVFPSLISYQGKLALQTIFIDIHDKKIAQEEADRKSEEHVMLLDNIDIHIWYLSDPETYAVVNRSHADFFGMKKKQVQNSKITELFNIDEADYMIEKNREVFENRKPYKGEEWMTDAYGKRRLFQVTRTPKLNKSGRVDYVICSAADITVQKETDESIKEMILALRASKRQTEERANEVITLNRKLQESESKLMEINSSKDKFFSIISHDLKSPLMGIIGLSKVLASEADHLTNDEITEYSSSLYSATESLHKLLENLLHWSRIQRGVIEFSPSDFDIVQLVTLNAGLLRENFRQKGINFNLENDEEIFVRADMNMINTILRNLISNAVKFTNIDGNISVFVHDPEEGTVTVRVRDDGVGMKPEIKEKIFRIGNAITSEGTMHEKGTGLGLILCRELIEKNEGKIWVESAPGEGSTFYFTLPAGEPPPLE